jgi:hypothetical protein
MRRHRKREAVLAPSFEENEGTDLDLKKVSPFQQHG